MKLALGYSTYIILLYLWGPTTTKYVLKTLSNETEPHKFAVVSDKRRWMHGNHSIDVFS